MSWKNQPAIRTFSQTTFPLLGALPIEGTIKPAILL